MNYSENVRKNEIAATAVTMAALIAFLLIMAIFLPSCQTTPKDVVEAIMSFH